MKGAVIGYRQGSKIMLAVVDLLILALERVHFFFFLSFFHDSVCEHVQTRV